MREQHLLFNRQRTPNLLRACLRLLTPYVNFRQVTTQTPSLYLFPLCERCCTHYVHYRSACTPAEPS